MKPDTLPTAPPSSEFATTSTCTAFRGGRQLVHGPVAEVAIRLAQLADTHGVLVLDDTTGRQIELDLRGDEAQLRSRYQPAVDPLASADGAPTARPRGRPRMGVVAREVTLLPEHWNWLASQPGGASVVLRRLVHEARKSGEAPDRRRLAQERSYQAMLALAGDRPGFEAASRALFAGDRPGFDAVLAEWPVDVRAHLARLLGEDGRPGPASGA